MSPAEVRAGCRTWKFVDQSSQGRGKGEPDRVLDPLVVQVLEELVGGAGSVGVRQHTFQMSRRLRREEPLRRERRRQSRRGLNSPHCPAP